MLFQASNPSQQSNVGSSLPCSHQQQSDQEQDTHTLSCFNISTCKFELLPIPTSVAPLFESMVQYHYKAPYHLCTYEASDQQG